MPSSYNIHGLVKTLSYSPKIFPGYFQSTPSDNYDIITRRASIGENLSRPVEIAPGLYYSSPDKSVISCIGIFGFQVYWSLKGLWEPQTDVSLSRNYEILDKTFLAVPVSTLFPIRAYIQHILHLKLLLKRNTFTVGGGVHLGNHGKALIITSMGGMGKTTATLNALRYLENASFMGDDMLIVNGDGTIYAYPKDLRIRRVEQLMLETHLPPSKKLGNNLSIKNTSKAGAIVFLERSQTNALRVIDPADALRRLLSINRKLLCYHMERTILAYSYMDNSVSLFELMRIEEEILSKFIKRTNCYIAYTRLGEMGELQKMLRLVSDEING
jgi:hypothetical protein